MKPAILLIGTHGQVGRELQQMLPRVGEVTPLDRERLDLTRPEEIRRAIRTFRPEFIVNAAAYTAVDKAESEESACASDQRRSSGHNGRRSQKDRRFADSLLHQTTFSTDRKPRPTRKTTRRIRKMPMAEPSLKGSARSRNQARRT